MLKIAFVGFGSIARRHILNLHTLLGRRGAAHEIDVYRRGKRPIDDPAAAKVVSHIYDASEVGKQEYDILFITNPTSTHYETLRQWAPYARSVFIEKPVFDDPDQDLSALPLRPDGVYYVACPLRYNPVLQYAKTRIDMTNVVSARAICSSHLPGWWTGRDYGDC